MKDLALQDLAHLIGVEIGPAENSQVFGYQIDSREVRRGDLFFALSGEKTDGHQFLADVERKGAVAAVVSRPGYQGSLKQLVVADVLVALQSLARALLKRYPVPILGITGSVGKTTVKDFAATLLAGKFRVGKNPFSHNSKITCPLSLLGRSSEEELMVLEMGMSSPGDITALVEIAPPEVAIVTQIALAHAQNFPGGIHEIAAAKAEIFSHPATRVGVLDAALLSYPEIRERLPKEKVLISMEDRSADIFFGFSDNRFFLDEWGVRVAQFDLPFKEKHFVQNTILAMAAARQFGMQWQEIECELSNLTFPKMRFERFERNGICFVNDAYNANPASMRAALENIPEPKLGGKKIAVLGTMKELGSFSFTAHQEIGHLAQSCVDLLLCLGEEAEPLCRAFREGKKPAEFFLDQEALVEKLRELLSPGDVVLFKASRSMQFEKILEQVLVC